MKDFKEYENKTVLVTGGAGCIGGNLCRTLARMNAREVIILDDLSCAYEWNVPTDDNITFIKGKTGWIETGDNAEFEASSQSLLLRRGTPIPGYPADFHVRDFLDCVKTRALTRANADAACWAHVACHAANIALFLDRKITYDPKKNEFPGDEQANRLRSEALREPWRI